MIWAAVSLPLSPRWAPVRCILWDALLGVGTRNVHAGKRIWDQLALVGFESLPIVLITMLFSGMVFGLQIARQFVLFGAGQFVGGVVAVSMARELAPTLTGIIVAARIGSAFAAEIGSMKITTQIDALRALAANPMRYLVTPRLVASAHDAAAAHHVCQCDGHGRRRIGGDQFRGVLPVVPQFRHHVPGGL